MINVMADDEMLTRHIRIGQLDRLGAIPAVGKHCTIINVFLGVGLPVSAPLLATAKCAGALTRE